MILHNKYDKLTLKTKLAGEQFRRITLSFYRYVILDDIENFRDDFYARLSQLDVLGRIYLAHEGINAQLSVPEQNWSEFVELINSYVQFKNVDMKIAIEDDGKSFYKLIVRIRKKIVAETDFLTTVLMSPMSENI